MSSNWITAMIAVGITIPFVFIYIFFWTHSEDKSISKAVKMMAILLNIFLSASGAGIHEFLVEMGWVQYNYTVILEYDFDENVVASDWQKLQDVRSVRKRLEVLGYDYCGAQSEQNRIAVLYRGADKIPKYLLWEVEYIRNQSLPKETFEGFEQNPVCSELKIARNSFSTYLYSKETMQKEYSDDETAQQTENKVAEKQGEDGKTPTGEVIHISPVIADMPPRPPAYGALPQSMPMTQETGTATGIVWTDSAFEQCIRTALSKPSGSITAEECAVAESLELWGNGLKTLDDLRYFPNVTSLHITGADNPNLAPIGLLANLTELSIVDCGIEDISALSALYRLNYLCLEDNQITDVSPLADLRQIEELYLMGNPISDVSCIADVIANTCSISLDVGELWRNEMDYGYSQEFAHLMDFVNYHRSNSGRETAVFNHPNINYFFDEYHFYCERDTSGNYLHTLEEQYGVSFWFREELAAEERYRYENIVHWMSVEHGWLLDDMINIDEGGRVFISMHYSEENIVIELAVG